MSKDLDLTFDFSDVLWEEETNENPKVHKEEKSKISNKSKTPSDKKIEISDEIEDENLFNFSLDIKEEVKIPQSLEQEIVEETQEDNFSEDEMFQETIQEHQEEQKDEFENITMEIEEEEIFNEEKDSEITVYQWSTNVETSEVQPEEKKDFEISSIEIDEEDINIPIDKTLQTEIQEENIKESLPSLEEGEEEFFAPIETDEATEKVEETIDQERAIEINTVEIEEEDINLVEDVASEPTIEVEPTQEEKIAQEDTQEKEIFNEKKSESLEDFVSQWEATFENKNEVDFEIDDVREGLNLNEEMSTESIELSQEETKEETTINLQGKIEEDLNLEGSDENDKVEEEIVLEDMPVVTTAFQEEEGWKDGIIEDYQQVKNVQQEEIYQPTLQPPQITPEAKTQEEEIINMFNEPEEDLSQSTHTYSSREEEQDLQDAEEEMESFFPPSTPPQQSQAIQSQQEEEIDLFDEPATSMIETQTNTVDEEVDLSISQIAKVELWVTEQVSKKKKFTLKKIHIIGIIVVIVLVVTWYFLKDMFLKPSSTNPTQQTSSNETTTDTEATEATEEWTEWETTEEDEEADAEAEEAKNKLLLEQKANMEKQFPFYKVVSLTNISFVDYLADNFNVTVQEKFDKILDPQVRESTVFLYQYKAQKLSAKKLVSILKKSEKGDMVAFKLIANLYWKLNKKVALVEKKLKTKKGIAQLKTLLIKQLNTNVPFVASINKELEAIANKSNNRLALFVYNNRLKDLRQTIVETKPSIQELLNEEDYIYFDKWLSLPETKNYNIKQEQKMTEMLLKALLNNDRIVSVLKKTPDKIATEIENSSVLKDGVDLTYKIDFYHKYLSDMLKINLEEN